MAINKVGVVGAGQMGNGIAHVFALAGYDVMMTDISADALAAAVALIDKNITRQVSKGVVSEEDKAAAMARISTTQTLTDLGPCDLIIEAATERETVKQAIFDELLPHIPPTTILASNTSSISITRRASRTDRIAAGSGLGLAIARGLTQAMGGRLAAESPLGDGTRGTRMTLRFPAT